MVVTNVDVVVDVDVDELDVEVELDDDVEVDVEVELDDEVDVEVEVELVDEVDVDVEVDVVVVIVTQVALQPPGDGLSGVFGAALKSQPSSACLTPSPQYVHASPTPALFGRQVFDPGSSPGRKLLPSQFSPKLVWRTPSPQAVQSLRHWLGVPFGSLVVLPSSQNSRLACTTPSPQIVHWPGSPGARQVFVMPAGQVGHCAGVGIWLMTPVSHVSLAWSFFALPQ